MKLFILIISLGLALSALELIQVAGIKVELRYASTHNFVGSVIDGYSAPECLLKPKTSQALQEVEAELNKSGMHLLIYDCYRPQRAVDHFVRWAEDINETRSKAEFYPNIKKSELFVKGYIAYHSGHTRGDTVDLSIIELDFGTAYDYFDEASHTLSKKVDKKAQANRLYLKDVMQRHGFKGLKEEWWHFTLIQ